MVEDYWEGDEVGYYRVAETSCQVDYYSSEYIQLNWWFESDMMTSSLRDLNRIKVEQRKKELEIPEMNRELLLGILDRA